MIKNLLNTPQSLKASEEQKESQRTKTAALLQANKAAATQILQGALKHLEKNTSNSTVMSKKLWI